jgi:glycosyltransferase 2 family protein
VSALTNWLVWKAMGQAWPLPAALLLLVVLQAGVAVPSSPGRIGVFQYLTILTLSLFAVAKAVALSYSVLLHLTTYAPMLGLGAYYLWREKTTWQKLEEAARRLEGRLRGASASSRE